MSYESENLLVPGASMDDVREFVHPMEYAKSGILRSEEFDDSKNISVDATDSRGRTLVHHQHLRRGATWPRAKPPDAQT
jgi:hypothetical protein